MCCVEWFSGRSNRETLFITRIFGFKVYTTFAGVAFNATALLLSVLGIALVLKQFWEGVLVRAVASWIVASTLMVLVLSFTKVLKL